MDMGSLPVLGNTDWQWSPPGSELSLMSPVVPNPGMSVLHFFIISAGIDTR